MDIDNINISSSIIDTINDNHLEIVSDIGDYTLNQLITEGPLKNVPFISKAINLYKAANYHLDMHNIRKLIIFINTINDFPDEEKRSICIKLKNNDKYMNKQLHYLLLILSRIVEERHASLLGKVFIAFVDEKINITDLRKYAFAINMLFPSDYDVLLKGDIKIHSMSSVDESYMRLMSLGMMYEDIGNLTYESSSSDGSTQDIGVVDCDNHLIRLTNFGRIFIEVTK